MNDIFRESKNLRWLDRNEVELSLKRPVDPSKFSQYWKVNGKLHRLDGPAVISPDGTQIWYWNDAIHRLDGPAVIWDNGAQEWWEYGDRMFIIHIAPRTIVVQQNIDFSQYPSISPTDGEDTYHIDDEDLALLCLTHAVMIQVT